MQSYTAKPAAPITVQAVQYVAPDGADELGNLDELKAVGDVREQTPWNPLGGQNYAVVVTGAGKVEALEPGGWLIVDDNGAVAIATDEQFRASFDVPDAAPIEDKAPKSPAGRSTPSVTA